MHSSEQKIPSIVLSIDHKRRIVVFDVRMVVCFTSLKVVVGSLLVGVLLPSGPSFLVL